MGAPPRTIGIYGYVEQETVHRNLSGMLRYCDETGGFAVHDFRMIEMIEDYLHVPPPWRGRVDGLVLSMGRGVANLSDKQLANWAMQGGVPTVSVAADWLDARIPTFCVNRTALSRLAAQHLVQCECASYLYIGYQRSTGSPARGASFRKALAAAGHDLVEYETNCGFAGSFEDEALALEDQGLVSHLRKLPKPLGVWTLNDNFASALCLLCAALDLAVPEQVKVLGVGDYGKARTHRPALSSIRTPSEEIGYVAMRALHQMLDGNRTVRKVTQVPVKDLVARASTVGAPTPNGNVDAAIDYIARHACARLTVEQVVEAMGISRRSLEERFQRLVGHSPGQEIQRVRLEKAKELLSKSHVSISRIASMVGFEETAALSKFFTKQTGMSPTEYRDARLLRTHET